MTNNLSFMDLSSMDLSSSPVRVGVYSKSQIQNAKQKCQNEAIATLAKLNLERNDNQVVSLEFSIQPITFKEKIQFFFSKIDQKFCKKAIKNLAVLASVCLIVIIARKTHLYTLSIFPKKSPLRDSSLNAAMSFFSSIGPLPLLFLDVSFFTDLIDFYQPSALTYRMQITDSSCEEGLKAFSTPVNDSDDDNSILDPILSNQIEKKWLSAPRFIYVTRMLYSLNSLLRALFSKPLENGQIKHPIFNSNLEQKDQEKLLKDLSRLFCIEEPLILACWDPFLKTPNNIKIRYREAINQASRQRPKEFTPREKEECLQDLLLEHCLAQQIWIWNDLTRPEQVQLRERLKDDFIKNARLTNFLSLLPKDILDVKIRNQEDKAHDSLANSDEIEPTFFTLNSIKKKSSENLQKEIDDSIIYIEPPKKEMLSSWANDAWIHRQNSTSLIFTPNKEIRIYHSKGSYNPDLKKYISTTHFIPNEGQIILDSNNFRLTSSTLRITITMNFGGLSIISKESNYWIKKSEEKTTTKNSVKSLKFPPILRFSVEEEIRLIDGKLDIPFNHTHVLGPISIEIGNTLFSLNSVLKGLFSKPLIDGKIQHPTENKLLTDEEQKNLISCLAGFFMIQEENILKCWDLSLDIPVRHTSSNKDSTTIYFSLIDKIYEHEKLGEEILAALKNQFEAEFFALNRLEKFLFLLTPEEREIKVQINGNELFTLSSIYNEQAQLLIRRIEDFLSTHLETEIKESIKCSLFSKNPSFAFNASEGTLTIPIFKKHQFFSCSENKQDHANVPGEKEFIVVFKPNMLFPTGCKPLSIGFVIKMTPSLDPMGLMIKTEQMTFFSRSEATSHHRELPLIPAFFLDANKEWSYKIIEDNLHIVVPRASNNHT